MKQRKPNKKGAVTDIFVFIILSFVVGVVCIMFYMISNITLDELNENAPSVQRSLSDGNNFTEIIKDTYQAYPRSLESLKWITVMLLVGLALGVMLSGYLVINVNKGFFILHIMIIILAVVIAVPLSNTYEILSEDATLSPYFSGFVGLGYIMNNLPSWTVVIGVLSSIIMLVGVIRSENQGGYY